MTPLKSTIWQLLAVLLVVAGLCACASADLLDDIDRNDTNDDKISPDEMAQIRTKVDAMSDAELSAVLAAAMPHQRAKRTLSTVRRCLEKVRCLFGNLKRHKRETSPAAVLRAISKLLGVANNAAKELLGKRLGGNNGLDLASLFRGPKASSSSSAVASDSLASSSSAVSQAIDEDNTTGEASEVVEEKVCDQRCNLSVLVYRRLRRLLRRL